MRPLAAAAAALLALSLLACTGAVTAPRAPPERVYDREEFKALVMGKTQAEVIEALGKPVRTSEAGSSQSWAYEGRSRDPVTGKTDRTALVIFEGGKATTVLY